MKLYLGILIALTALGCQKESFVQEEITPENDLVRNEQLNKAVLSVAAHDGSFDDILDGSGCFSVKFPYKILYQGKVIDILSVNDLLGIEPNETFQFQFPISITFSDYVELQINSQEELMIAQDSCASNQVFMDRIRCVDFLYPIKIALYNINTNTFETLVVNHDRENFVSVSTFLLGQKASINFPIAVQDQNGLISQVNTVNELIGFVYSNEENCDL